MLDIGAGDGLIAFGALDRLEEGQVTFSDISQDLLDHCQALAREIDVLDRCRFVQTSADDLVEIEDSSVDVVTTRSVLIYVEDKRRAFEEFYRVLKPGGRLSVFEPINSFYYPPPSHLFLGYDVTPVQDLARKVWAVFERRQPPDIDPMLNFDERDLFDLAEHTGFEEVHLHYEVEVKLGNPFSQGAHSNGWDTLLKSAGNPKIPTLGEAIDETLAPEEVERGSPRTSAR